MQILQQALPSTLFGNPSNFRKGIQDSGWNASIGPGNDRPRKFPRHGGCFLRD